MEAHLEFVSSVRSMEKTEQQEDEGRHSCFGDASRRAQLFSESREYLKTAVDGLHAEALYMAYKILENGGIGLSKDRHKSLAFLLAARNFGSIAHRKLLDGLLATYHADDVMKAEPWVSEHMSQWLNVSEPGN